MLWIWSKIGVGGIAWGLPLSLLITLPVAGTFLWLGRWTRGRPRLLLSAFAWGASVAPFCSIWSQEGLQALADTYVGTEFGQWFRPLVITPVTEELFKGLFLVWLLTYRRSQIRGLLDGIVYGGLIGAGFAFTEQILYFGQVVVNYFASVSGDSSAFTKLFMSFLLRGVMVPFMHSFFVVFIGLGVAWAAGLRSHAAQTACVALGFLFPIVLHGLWDWAGLAADDPFLIFKIYGFVMVPLFLGLAIFALALRRRQGTAISGALPMLAHDGHIAESEIDALSGLRERRRRRKDVRRRVGTEAARLVDRYQAEVSALAIMYRRSPAATDEQVQIVARHRSEMEAAVRSSPQPGIAGSL